MRPLNLASQPFRNETLPSLLVGLGAFVLAALTVQHVVAIRRLLPAQTSAAHRELEALEQEAARLREESRQVRVTRPEPAVLAEWTQLKELVDRRALRRHSGPLPCLLALTALMTSACIPLVESRSSASVNARSASAYSVLLNAMTPTRSSRWARSSGSSASSAARSK